MHRAFSSHKRLPQLRMIESTIPFGLSSINRFIPVHTRSELIKRLVSSGISNVYAGNLNCNGPLFGTRDLLLDTKDIGYGERTLSTAVLTPTMIGSFLSSGSDELVIPVNLRLPFCLETSLLFKDEIFLARSNRHTVRLQIDGICESNEEDCRRLIEHFVLSGITRVTLLVEERICTPSFISLLLRWMKDLVPKECIALGFQHKSLSNVYTGIEEGIETYHTSLGGLGNYTNTLHLAEFAREQKIEIPNLDLFRLRETDRWWKRQVYH